MSTPDPDLSGVKILATTEYVPWNSSGGTDQVTWQVATRLVRLGASVTLVAGLPPEVTAMPPPVVEGVTVIALPTVNVGRHIGVELAFPRRARRALAVQLAASSRAVLYGNGLHFPLTWSLAQAAKSFGRPLVTTCHVGAVPLSSRLKRLAQPAYEATVARMILRRSDEVVAVSNSVRDHVLPIAGRTPVTVVPNGVDLHRFAPSRFDLSKRPTVVFVGRLIENKGPAELVAALVLLQSWNVSLDAAFVGDGPEREELERLVSASGLENVRFYGHRVDVEKFISTGDIFVRPSSSEGMPLAILEAMSSGCCVVATRVPGTTEILVSEANSLLVDYGDPFQLATALSRLANDSRLRQRLSNAAAADARGYSWDATASRSAEVLLRALHEHDNT